MVIESDRKNYRHRKQNSQHALVTRADDQQEKEANEEDDELGRDDVREDGADKKTVLTLVKREAAWAVMPDVKRSCNYSGFATSGTKKSQTTPQHPFDLFKICFQGPELILRDPGPNRKRWLDLDTGRGLR